MDKDLKSQDWKKISQVAFEACMEGRKTLLHYFGQLKKIEEKFQAGLVSEADQESEKVITAYLKKYYPGIEMLGEESAFQGAKVQGKRGGPEGRWILDPLDGTTNYIHQFPVFCISLALEVDGDLKLGLVDVPIFEETYTAYKGGGAFVNGQKISVSKTQTLEKSLLATGFFADDASSLEEQLRIFSHLVRKCRGIRRAGAAAYDLCQVARGVFDAYWEKNLKAWDTAAGQIIVEEAGGKLMTYEGADYNPYDTSMIAGNPMIARQVQECVKVLV